MPLCECKLRVIGLSLLQFGSAACGGTTQTDEQETKAGCVVDGEALKDGQSIASSDGCNVCTCEDGQPRCSQVACTNTSQCKDEICYPAGSCLLAGNLVLPEETVLASDGCNTCSCASGKIECTAEPCGTGCFAPAPFDDPDCTDGEELEIYWNDPDLGFCRQKPVLRCGTNLADGYFHTNEECEAACPNDMGLGCVVGGQLHPHGSSFTDPFSCNGCSCYNGGKGECSQGGCTRPCPEGTGPGEQCGVCGGDGRCEAIEIACLPLCDGDGGEPCVAGGCVDGLCVTACQ